MHIIALMTIIQVFTGNNCLLSASLTDTIEIFNADVIFREDCSCDDLIDVIIGNRVYMPCLYVSECTISTCVYALPLRK